MNITKCCKYSWMSYYPVQKRIRNQIVSIEGKNNSRVLYCKEDNSTYVSFRGTYNKENLRSCMNAEPITTVYGKVHKGFFTIYMSLRNEICSLLEKDDSQNILFTGHSMGGAVAIISSIDNLESLKKRGKNIYCCTFGTPCTSDKDFMTYARENLDNILNIELPYDVVPYLTANPVFTNPSNLVILPGSEKKNSNMMDIFKNHSCKEYYRGVFML